MSLLPVLLFVSHAAAYEPCGISLKSLSAASAAPGEEFSLLGAWGASQGRKLPVINRGGMRLLEVVDWSPEELRVRVPADLKPGSYRVGVYCNPLSEGGSFASGFADFVVVAGAGEPAAASSPRSAASPDATQRPTDSREGEALDPVLNGVPSLASLLVFLAVFAVGAWLTLRGGVVRVGRGPPPPGS